MLASLYQGILCESLTKKCIICVKNMPVCILSILTTMMILKNVHWLYIIMMQTNSSNYNYKTQNSCGTIAEKRGKFTRVIVLKYNQ